MTGFSIRPMRSEDEPFVFRAWLEGYWPHFPGNVVMSKGEFLRRWHTIIERILADRRTKTIVATVEGQPEALLGFACGSAECLHWCYVKQAFRGLGIGKALQSTADGDSYTASHWSGWLRRNAYGWQYTPDLLKEYTL